MSLACDTAVSFAGRVHRSLLTCIFLLSSRSSDRDPKFGWSHVSGFKTFLNMETLIHRGPESAVVNLFFFVQATAARKYFHDNGNDNSHGHGCDHGDDNLSDRLDLPIETSRESLVLHAELWVALLPVVHHVFTVEFALALDYEITDHRIKTGMIANFELHALFLPRCAEENILANGRRRNTGTAASVETHKQKPD